MQVQQYNKLVSICCVFMCNEIKDHNTIMFYAVASKTERKGNHDGDNGNFRISVYRIIQTREQ